MYEFEDILTQATAAVEGAYFQLPVAGKEDPIYRERVYCYELYHQMRVRWPHASPLSLAGEIDKAGHPLIRGNGLDKLKPDFLVHIPGDMGGNFAVIEVKPVNASLSGVKKDMETLLTFRRYAGYEKAVLLIYGGGGLAAMNAQNTQLLLGTSHEIEVWVHAMPGESAMKLVL